MMKNWQLIGSVLLLCVAAGCSNFLSSSTVSRSLLYVDDGVEEPEDFPILHATGYAQISRQRGPTATDRTLQAMRASKVEAYRELAEQVYGVYIKASSRQRSGKESSDQVTAQVDGVLQGARVIRQYPLADAYVTEVELDTQVLYDLYLMRGAL